MNEGDVFMYQVLFRDRYFMRGWQWVTDTIRVFILCFLVLNSWVQKNLQVSVWFSAAADLLTGFRNFRASFECNYYNGAPMKYTWISKILPLQLVRGISLEYIDFFKSNKCLSSLSNSANPQHLSCPSILRCIVHLSKETEITHGFGYAISWRNVEANLLLSKYLNCI